MKHQPLTTLTAATLLLAGSIASADATKVVPFAFSSTARPINLTLSPRHPSFKTAPKLMLDGKKVVQIPREADKPRVGYFGSRLGQSAPGTMLITLENKFAGEVANATLSLNYNKLNGRNGSAGSEKATFVPAAGWETKVLSYTVVPETAAIQYIFGFNGKAGSAWNIARVSLEYAPDTVKLQEKTPNYSQKPSQWGRFPQADCFFNYESGNVEQARTAVKFAYDKNNLYVGYICYEPEMKLLKSSITEHDGNVWKDDCVEFFFYSPEKDVIKQFMTNPIGTKAEVERVQAQAGDPYKVRKWDGEWQTRTWKNAKSWEVAMIIPWKTLGYDTIPANPMAVNFVRERFANKEVSQWNCYVGDLAEVNNFARVDFAKKEMVRSRKVEKVNYIPQRKKTQFKNLLSSEKIARINYMWSNEYFLVYQLPAVKAKHTLESIASHQRMLLKEWAKAGTVAAGMPYVLLARNTVLKIDELAASGVKFPFVAKSHSRSAKKAGAKAWLEVNPNDYWVDLTDSVAVETCMRAIDSVAADLKKDPRKAKMTSFIHGVDEPGNYIRYIYSRSRNIKNAAFLDEFEKMLKAQYGFGKYGLYDDYGIPTADDAFERIAFWRWWNDRFAAYCQAYAQRCRQQLPGVPFQVFNRNTCAGTDPIDVALCGNDDYIISSDPYPTSSRSYFGMARALYHTGFSVKLMRDLAPKATINFYGQGFNYCGGTPKPADLREWASQGLKNGADYVQWYTVGSLAANPAVYNEALNITRQINDLPKLKLPKETKTGIFYSDFDRWGLNDGAAHSQYTVYAILGEHIKSNFRFVSKKDFNVADLKMLYIPRMRFTEPDLTAKLVKFVKDGGTIVVLDPDFLRFNIDGSAVAERAELVNAELVKKAAPGNTLLYGKAKLPLSKVSHINQKENGSIHAFDFARLPAGAKVLAKYNDGKPAIIERAVGKGKVIFSAVLPFGTSEAALAPVGWKQFMADRAQAVGEKMNLPIWDFVLPEVTQDKFNVKTLK